MTKKKTPAEDIVDTDELDENEADLDSFEDEAPRPPFETVVASKSKPAAARGVLDEFTYVLTAGDEHDVHDARVWRKKLSERSPDSAPKMVQEIKLARLTERHTVIALYRPDDGIERSKELVAGPPVQVRDHWRKDGDDGEVNTETFIGTLAKGILPAVVKTRRENIDEDLGTIRLGYA